MACLHNPTFCNVARDSTPEPATVEVSGCPYFLYPQVFLLDFYIPIVSPFPWTASRTDWPLIWNPSCPATTNLAAGGWWQGFYQDAIQRIEFRFRPSEDYACDDGYWLHEIAIESTGIPPFAPATVIYWGGGYACALCNYEESELLADFGAPTHNSPFVLIGASSYIVHGALVPA